MPEFLPPSAWRTLKGAQYRHFTRVQGAIAGFTALLGAFLLILVVRADRPEMVIAISLVSLAILMLLPLAAQRAGVRNLTLRSANDPAIAIPPADAKDLITRHDLDGRIRHASPAAQLLLGLSAESLAGQTPEAMVHPDDLPLLQNALTQASHFGRAAEAEVRLKRADGNYLWAEWRGHPEISPDGGATGIVAVTRDISRRKAREQEMIEARELAEAANRAKSAFLANMSHELRTPLNAIIGFSEVMGREMFGPLGSLRYREYSRLINDSGAHLLELINEVLDMSKIEAGKFELSEECFDFTDVAKQALRFVKLSADRKGVVLKAALARSASTLFADRRALKQMLINLLTNAIKFTPRGGEVRITAIRAKRGIEIAIADTGVGIAPEDVARLGRPFEQAEGRFVRMQEGTGLGLALVRALAGLHGGEMTIESTLGAGTIVRLHLPYAAVAENGSRLELPSAVSSPPNSADTQMDGPLLRGAA